MTLRATAIVLGLSGIAALYQASARHVSIRVDGQAVQVRTHARTIGAALRDAGVLFSAEDRVNPAPDQRPDPRQVIEVQHAFPVHLEIDARTRLVPSVSLVPANILAAAGERLFPGDRIWADGIRVDDPGRVLPYAPSRLRLKRALEAQVLSAGGALSLRSASPTLGEALSEAGHLIYEADQVMPDVNAGLDPLSRLGWTPSHPVTILVDGKRVETRAIGDKVEAVLARSGVVPVGLDYAVPDLDDPIPEDGAIRVVRVLEDVQIEQKPIPFEKVYQPMPDMEIDSLRVVEAGAYGVLTSRIRVRYEDGKEVARTAEGEWVAQEPKPEIVGYGTKVVLRVVDTPDGRLEYWRALTMYATSYSPSRAGVPRDAPNYGITASGLPAGKGLVAIDRRYIPFGTQMYVIGYGFALAADTGGGVKGRWIDLGYDDDNYVTWHQYVTVYFLAPVPPEGSIVWIIP